MVIYIAPSYELCRGMGHVRPATVEGKHAENWRFVYRTMPGHGIGVDSTHERWRGLLMVMAYGGLRFGEAAGLAPEDVVVGGVYVRRAVSETSRGLLLGPVKDHEERFVGLPRPVLRVLLRFAEAATGDFLFTTRRGGMLSVSSFRKQVWIPALDRRHVDYRPMKTLRAFAASLWLDAGASIEFVRDQLGHADLRTTQKYLETFSSRRESIMSRLDDRLESRSDVGPAWGWTAEAPTGS